jgi:phenylacetic acid degradation operon negative regulatory protein
MLNTLHEVLIFLEDRGKIALSEFRGWKSRQVRGALGRLERERWVKKEKKNGQIFYELSREGQKEIDKTLFFLRTHGKAWDGVWRLVMFDIPEKERDLRDKFRRGLVALNLRNLQGSVWVASSDIRQEVKTLAKEVGVSAERLNIFTARAEDDQNIAACWDLENLNKEYRKFTRGVKEMLKGKKWPESYAIKKTIFNYALLRRHDPNLSERLLPPKWAEEEAHAAYQELRRRIT